MRTSSVRCELAVEARLRQDVGARRSVEMGLHAVGAVPHLAVGAFDRHPEADLLGEGLRRVDLLDRDDVVVVADVVSASRSHSGSSTWSSVVGTSITSAAAGLDQTASVDLHRLAAWDRVDDLDRLRDLVRRGAGSWRTPSPRRTSAGRPGSAGSMMACTRRPHSSSLSPITTTSAIFGWSLSAASTSAGNTLAPPGDDQVDAPIDEVEVAVVVDVAHVADGAEPVVGVMCNCGASPRYVAPP